MPRTYGIDPERTIAAAHSNNNPNVKGPSERYSDVRYPAKHKKTGESLFIKGNEAQSPSQRDIAKLGAFFKFRAVRDGIGGVALSEHETGLINEMFEKDLWVVTTGDKVEKDVPGLRVKTLVYDSTSGGQYAVPVWFDDMLVLFPLLLGELSPYCTLIDVPRGATVNGASLANPTVTWGTGEGTAITLYNTNNMVAAVNTSIHPCAVAVQIGRDFLSDAMPIQIGDDLIKNMLQSMSASLDTQIASGDGVNEPLGLFLSSGTIIYSAINNTSGPFLVSDVEQMNFALPKQYRRSGDMRVRWVCNDSTYRRMRQLQVSGTDQRRIFGYDYESYQMLAWPVSINQGIPSVNLGLVDMSRYRLYRRDGAEIRVEDGGLQLLTTNTVIYMLRSRWGGRLVDSNAMVECNSAPNHG